MKKGKRRKIVVYETVDVEAEVDIKEYIDDFLEIAEDEELIKELECRGYHVSRSHIDKFEPLCKCGNKRFLCDLLGLSYYASNDEIINEIKKNI